MYAMAGCVIGTATAAFQGMTLDTGQVLSYFRSATDCSTLVVECGDYVIPNSRESVAIRSRA